MILHISNDYSGSTVYKNLVSSIDNYGYKQIVYNPVREMSRVGKNEISFKEPNSKILYRVILNYNTDRFFFKSKITKILKDIDLQVDFNTINIIHAHTWYSDGAVAYELYKKYNIPYIVTIRNTDLNLFYKNMLHLRNYGSQILTNAKQIIFISDVYRERFQATSLYKKNSFLLDTKLLTLYNGIDQFWIDNVKSRKLTVDEKCFKLLYIGKFDKGKNVKRLIDAVKILNKKKVVFSLTLVGGGGSEEKKILKEVEENDFINFLGPVFNKEDLASYFASHNLFVMPSKAETFGLVYLEAISQGIPIVNTINEGIYGMYDNVGESVKFNSISSISSALNEVKNNYENYNFNPINIVNNHIWSDIAVKYITLYKSILSNEF